MNPAMFFGIRADRYLELDRQAKAAAQATRHLASQLDQLQAERVELHRRHGEELVERTRRVAAAEVQLEEARQRAEAVNADRDRLARSLGSVWTRLGIRLRHLLSGAAPSLQQVRELLASTSREAQAAEAGVDELNAARGIELSQLRRVAVPIESVDYAIGFLNQLQESLHQEQQQRQAALDQLIRGTVRAADLLLLRGRLAALSPTSPTIRSRHSAVLGPLEGRDGAGAPAPGRPRGSTGTALDMDAPSAEWAELCDGVLRLKTLLILLEAFPGGARDERVAAESPEPATPVTAELAEEPQARLEQAVQAGFSWGTADASLPIRLQGEGRKNVRRTRRRSLPAHGGRRGARVQHRSETYWEAVPVQLDGSVPAEVSIRFPRWQPQRLSATLCDAAQAHFTNGATAFRNEVEAGALAMAEQEADRLTAEIRRLLEPARRQA